MKHVTLVKIFSIVFTFLIFSLQVFSFNGIISKEDLKIDNSIGLEENLGQFADVDGNAIPDILFKYNVKGVEVYVTKTGLMYFFRERQKKKESEPREKEHVSKVKWRRMDMVLMGAQINMANIERGQPTNQGYINYYLAHCPQGILKVTPYQKITISEIYPGIDWTLYSGSEGIKYDFLVHPGADPKVIKMLYQGAGDLVTGDNNDFIRIETDLGVIEEGKLYCYESRTKNVIASNYNLAGNVVSFKLDDYDRNQDLVIDPPMKLIWSTYYASNTENDGLMKIAVDKSTQNVYSIGYTSGSTMPVMDHDITNPNDYFSGVLNGWSNIQLLKFDANGIRIWATYLGGSVNDEGWGVAADANGNVFVTGSGMANFPVKDPGGGAYYQPALGGGGFDSDCIISKFNSIGEMQWSTYYGGNEPESGRDITIGPAGDVYVTGYAETFNGGNMPLFSPGGPGDYFQNNADNDQDVFILKFSNTGKRLWATYFGGDGLDAVNAIKVDNTGYFYITGRTVASTGFPIQNLAGANKYNQAIYNGSTASCIGVGQLGDAFIAKFDPGLGLVWSTYYGGSGSDAGHDISIDENNNVYIIGATNSPDLFTLQPANPSGYFQPTNAGACDAFLTKFSSDGTHKWSTYFGGSADEYHYNYQRFDYRLAIVAGQGNFYITGATTSADFPLKRRCGAFFRNKLEGMEAFVSQFDTTAFLKWSTFYGAPSQFREFGCSIDMNDAGCIYISGESNNAPNFPVMGQNGFAYQQQYTPSTGPADEGILFAFCPGKASMFVDIDTTNNNCGNACDGTADVTPSSGMPPYTYNWSDNSLPNSGIVNGLCTGSYTVTITSFDGCDTIISFDIDGPAPGTGLIVASNKVDVSSCGASDGSANVAPSNGTQPYTFLWSTGDTDSLISNLSASTPCVTVTDAEGCDTTVCFTIAEGALPIVDAGPDTSICIGESITLGGTPTAQGTGPFTYAWDNPGSLSDDDVANPVASPTATITYTVTVDNGGNCTVTDQVTITINPLPQANTNNDTSYCPGGSNELGGNPTATSGTGPYTYNWSPSSTLTPSATDENPTATPTKTTIYAVTVTDSNGCVDTNSITVTIYSLPNANAGTNDSICQGESSVLGASGGTDYQWNPTTTLSDDTITNPTATPTQTTTYTVTVTSSEGCTATDSLVITVYPIPQVDAGADDSVACGDTANLKATVIIGTSPLTYQWINGPNTANYDSVGAGIYEVKLTDGNGCTHTDSVEIKNIGSSLILVISVDDDTICPGDSAVITATVTGAVGAVTYNWSNNLPNDSVPKTVFPDSTTNYSLTIKDGAGCTQTKSLTVFVSPEIFIDVSPDTICSGDTAQLSSSGGVQYVWEPAGDLSNFQAQNPKAFPNVTTTYTVTVTDGNGCADDSSVVLTVNPTPVADAGGDTSLCDGECAVINGSGSGNLTWDPTSGLTDENTFTPTACPTVTTTYMLSMVNVFNCADSDEVVITMNPLPTVDAGDSIGIQCAETANLTATPQGGTSPYTYLWNPPVGGQVTAQTITGLQANTYYVTITDSKGCTDNDTVVVYNVNSDLQLTVSNDTTICEGDTAYGIITAQGSNIPLTYTWNPIPPNPLPPYTPISLYPLFTTTYGIITSK